MFLEPFKPKTKNQKTLGKGVFWIYADSTGRRFFKDIVNTKFCSAVFQSCKLTINKIYMERYNGTQFKEVDEKDFDTVRVLKELEEILTDPLINDTNSVLMLNYGLHYVVSISFQTFNEMMDRIINLLISFQPVFKGNIIWRTTSAINRWKYETFVRPSQGFLTEPVSSCLNFLKSSKLC